MTSQEKVDVAIQRVNHALIGVSNARAELDAARSEWAVFASFVALIPASLQPIAAVDSELSSRWNRVVDAELAFLRAKDELTSAREARSAGIDAGGAGDSMVAMKCVTDAIEGDGWLFDNAVYLDNLRAADLAIVRVIK